MSFKITITKTETKEVYAGKDWEEGVKKETDDSSSYGYTPEITKHKEITTEILSQVVDELDLPKVIRALNQIE